MRRPKISGNIRGGEEDENPYSYGFAVSGYDNMGAGNTVRIGPAGRNEADVGARGHDIVYGEEQERGVNPYVNWVDADDEFLDNLNPTNWKEKAAQLVFSTKKALKNTGVIGDMARGQKRKQIRASPWEEGEQFRTARHARNRLRKQHLNRLQEMTEREAKDNAEHTDMPPLEDWPDEEVRGMDIAPPDEEEENMEMDVDGEGNWWESSELVNIDSLPNLPASAQMSEAMDTSGEEPEVMALRNGGGPGNQVSKETPISIYPTLSYGLQETHTTILPFTYWFSADCSSHTAPAVHKIRLNSIYDFITTAVATLAAGTAPTLSTCHSRPIGPNGKSALNAFPTVTNDGTAVETPYWRNYWTQLYEYYTVLGCEYKITLDCPMTSSGHAAMVGHTIDSWSNTATETGNITPTTNIAEAMSFKGMRFTPVESARPEEVGRNRKYITGRYKPGQVKRNIVNDGDVKTWTVTDFDGAAPASSVPTLKETLNLFFWRHPLAHLSNTATDEATVTAVNVQVELKWIVQFKDLRDMARYPRTQPTGTTIKQEINNTQTTLGNPMARWV